MLTRPTSTPASTVIGCSQLKLRCFIDVESPSTPTPPPRIKAPKPTSR